MAAVQAKSRRIHNLGRARSAEGQTIRLSSFRLLNFIALIILSAVGGLGAVKTCAAENAKPIGKHLSIVREDGRSFKLSRLGSPTVRVTFLAPETVRVICSRMTRKMPNCQNIW